MKRLLLATASLVLMSSVGYAKCGTKQLNGTWLMGVAGTAEVIEVVILDGVLGGEFSISQTIGCKVTANIKGVDYRGRSDRIPSSSSAKPGIIVIANDAENSMFTMTRK